MSNPAHRTLIECNVELSNFLSYNSMDISNSFLSAELISEELHGVVANEPEKSAGRIVNCLIDRVDINEDDFHKILLILEVAECSGDIVDILKNKYGKKFE